MAVRWRRLGEDLLLLVVAVAAAGVAPAHGECWTRSDGATICTREPTGWVVLWGVWLAALLLAGAFIGYSDCCFGSVVGRCKSGDKSEFQEPLLAEDHLAGSAMEGEDGDAKTRVQPIYRYLD